MSDEISPDTPPEGQEPGAGTPEQPTLPESNNEPVQTQEPEPSTEDKILHKFQSWYGRREQQLIDSIKSMIPQQPQEKQQPAPDPAENADAWFEHKFQSRVNQVQQYNDSLLRSGTEIIENDPLMKSDAAIRDEIIQEIQSGRVPVNRNLDPVSAASVAIAMAKSNVLTRRLTQPKNPLSGNAPSSTPKGGITPPAAPPAPKPKLEKVSGLAKSAARRWGYSDEELAKVLGAE